MKAWIALTVAFAVPLFPADFWEKKKHSDWTENETWKILEDSPWAASVSSVPRGRSVRPAPSVFDAERGGPIIVPGADESRGGGGGAGTPGMGPPRGRRGGFGSGRGIVPVPSLMLRWHSALPVQQAVVNLRFDAHVAAPDAVQELSPRDHHVLGIYGLPVTVAQMRPEQLRRAVSLKTRRDRIIHPASVYLDRGGTSGPEPGLPGPRAGYTLFVFFPRGERGILLEDKEIEVLFQMGRAEYKKKFKLDKMIVGGRLEI